MEVLVAMVLITIIVIGTLEFCIFCQKNFLINSTLRLMAVNFAREQMEELYFLGPNDPALDSGAGTNNTLPEAGEFADTLRTKYSGQRSYTVTQPDSNYKVIQVTVTWNL